MSATTEPLEATEPAEAPKSRPTPWAGGRVELDLTTTPEGADVKVRLFDQDGPEPFHRLTPDISTAVRAFDLRFDWGRRNGATLQLALAVLMEIEAWRSALEHAKDFRERVMARIPRGERVRVMIYLAEYDFDVLPNDESQPTSLIS